jgi:hypothetical protein
MRLLSSKEAMMDERRDFTIRVVDGDPEETVVLAPPAACTVPNVVDVDVVVVVEDCPDELDGVLVLLVDEFADEVDSDPAVDEDEELVVEDPAPEPVSPVVAIATPALFAMATPNATAKPPTRPMY